MLENSVFSVSSDVSLKYKEQTRQVFLHNDYDEEKISVEEPVQSLSKPPKQKRVARDLLNPHNKRKTNPSTHNTYSENKRGVVRKPVSPEVTAKRSTSSHSHEISKKHGYDIRSKRVAGSRMSTSSSPLPAQNMVQTTETAKTSPSLYQRLQNMHHAISKVNKKVNRYIQHRFI